MRLDEEVKRLAHELARGLDDALRPARGGGHVHAALLLVRAHQRQELSGGPPRGEQRAEGVRHLLGRVHLAVGVERDAVPHRASQQPVNRQPERLPGNVPQGHVDAGQRAHLHRSAAPPVAQKHPVPEVFAPQRVLADHKLGKVPQRLAHRTLAAHQRGLAQAGEPVVRAHQDVNVTSAGLRHDDAIDGRDAHGNSSRNCRAMVP